MFPSTTNQHQLPSRNTSYVGIGIGFFLLLVQILRKRQRYLNAIHNPSSSTSTDDQLRVLRSLLIQSLNSIDYEDTLPASNQTYVSNSSTQPTDDKRYPVGSLSSSSTVNRCPWVYKAEGAANITFTYNDDDDWTSRDSRQYQTNYNTKYSIFRGLILRVKKVPHSYSTTNLPLPTQQQPFISSSTASSPSSSSSSSLNTLFPHDPLHFAQTIMRPLLGKEYIVSGISIAVTPENMRTLSKILHDSVMDRPLKRRNDKIDETITCIVLMLDHTLLTGLLDIPKQFSLYPISTFTFPTLCVEIKPKAGIIPVCSNGHVYSSLYHKACRFCMHQISKGFENRSKHVSPVLHPSNKNYNSGTGTVVNSTSSTPVSLCHYCQKEPRASLTNRLCSLCLDCTKDTLSQYCPIHLYSKESNLIYRTLHGLLHYPQNNLRIFENGRTVFTAESMKKTMMKPTVYDYNNDRNVTPTSMLNSYFPWLDNYIATCYRGTTISSTVNSTTLILQILTQILLTDPVLQKLQTVQSLATLSGNIEDVYARYRELEISLQPHLSHSGQSVSQQIEEYLASHPRSKETSAIRDFLIAQTAKDVSLLISLQIFPSPPFADSNSSVIRIDNESVYNSTSVLLDIQHMQRNMGEVFYASPDNRIRLRIYYSIAIVDVDEKSIGKIPYYYEQEKSILSLFQSYGEEIFQYNGKVCGIQQRSRENEE